MVGVAEPRSRAFRDDTQQSAADRLGNFGSENPVRLGFDRHIGFVRGAGGEFQPLEIDGRQPHPVVEDDPHQIGERIGPIAGTADRGAVGGHDVPERVALPLPVLQDAIKRVLSQQNADPEVLLVGALRVLLHHSRTQDVELAAANLTT
jgi:hypothetical protein